MLPHRLGRALVGLFAGGVVLHPDVGRDIPVHGVDRRADVAAKRHAPGRCTSQKLTSGDRHVANSV